MPWQTLLDNVSVSLDEWFFTPIVNDAKYFRITHNLEQGTDKLVGQVSQIEQGDSQTLYLFDQKRFLFLRNSQILQFDRPEFIENRVLAIQVVDLRDFPVELELRLKVEFYPHVEGVIDNAQLNHIEQVGDDTNNRIQNLELEMIDLSVLVKDLRLIATLQYSIQQLQGSNAVYDSVMTDCLDLTHIFLTQGIVLQRSSRLGFYILNPYSSRSSIILKLLWIGNSDFEPVYYTLPPGQIYLDESNFKGDVVAYAVTQDTKVLVKEIF